MQSIVFLLVVLCSLLFRAVAHTSFLNGLYCADGDNSKFLVRQVPGDGGCLFHSLAVSLTHSMHNTHFEFDGNMRNLSNSLRSLSVDVLQQDKELVVEDGAVIDTKSLLQSVGDHYGISPEEYCEQMKNLKTWGGGPEIVALSNCLYCPIHIYQLTNGGFLRNSFKIKLSAKFGSPNFDYRKPLRILCADGRFPNVQPGKHKKVGDHFLALFPFDSKTDKRPVSRLPPCPSLNIKEYLETVESMEDNTVNNLTAATGGYNKDDDPTIDNNNNYSNKMNRFRALLKKMSISKWIRWY